jgi:outer membrane protein W
MKRLLVLFFCVTSLVFFFSSNVLAAGPLSQNYFVVKAGMYSPQSDDLEEFDEGFNGEIAWGHYFNQNLAVELGLGYFHTESSESGYVYYYGTRYASATADIDVMPLTVALKAIAPIGQAELYALGGIGMYFASGEIDGTIAGVGSASASDDDVAFGGFLGAGVNFNLTNQVFIGVEGKYHWVEANWEYEGLEVDAELDGWTFTGNLGFRF